MSYEDDEVSGANEAADRENQHRKEECDECPHVRHADACPCTMTDPFDPWNIVPCDCGARPPCETKP